MDIEMRERMEKGKWNHRQIVVLAGLHNTTRQPDGGRYRCLVSSRLVSTGIPLSKEGWSIRGISVGFFPFAFFFLSFHFSGEANRLTAGAAA